MLEILVEDFVGLDVYCINSQLKPNVGWDVGNRIFWSKKLRDQSCRVTRMSEYRGSEEQDTPIYLVTVPDIEGFFKSDWVRVLPKSTVEKLKRYNLPILLSQPDEYFVRYDKHQIENFDRALSQIGLDTNTIFTHSINISYDSNQCISVGQRKIFNFFSYGWLNTAAINPVKPLTDEIQRDRDYLCINRTMRDLRCLFYLNYTSRKDNAYVSFIAEYGGKPVQHLNYKFNIALQYVSEDFRQTLSNYIPEAISTLPKFLDSEENQRVKGISNSDLELLRNRVWFEIVTETHDIDYDDTDIAILTEKTLFAMARCLPFVVLGHRKIYKLLTDLGFQMYDFDYDPDCDITERFNQLNRFLDQFKTWDTATKQQWFDRQQARALHNKNLLFNTNWTQLESELLVQSILRDKVSST